MKLDCCFHRFTLFLTYSCFCLLMCHRGGESYFSAALNSWIHVLMYGYYLWATFSSNRSKTDPTYRPRFWEAAYWRRYITSLQMIQFMMNFFQASYDIFYRPPKNFPIWAIWMLLIYMCTMLALFGNFYRKAYGGKKGAKGDKKAQTKKTQ